MAQFIPRPGTLRYCSILCRLWAKTDQTPGLGAGDCWLWIGATRGTPKIGVISLHGRAVAAHRVIYVETHGAIPKGKRVVRSCSNPLCVNPAHLCAAGSHTECLSDSDVDDIREQRQSGKSARSIAASMGVSRSHVYSLLAGRRRRSR